MPSKLNKGIVEVVSDYVVCRQGDRLTPQQVQTVDMAAMRVIPPPQAMLTS